MTCPSRVWDGVLYRLGAELPAFALEAWLRPLAAAAEGAGLCLLCPNRFHMERVRARYLAHIERCAAAETGARVPVTLTLAGAAGRRAASRASSAAAAPRQTASRPAAPPPAATAAPTPQRELPYSFDNFVVGACNALAREASIAVAHARQRALSPLYLASAPGLGKTHLARAIAIEARRSSAGRVLYRSAEGFTNEFLTAIRARCMDDFKRRYRHGCDVLLVEDVQFLSAKHSTQLELFHTIVHLLDARARVVLTGDRLPRDIDDLEPRLRSQMTAGLVAQIEPPDATVRRRILRTKAAAGGVHLPDDCLDLLVESVRGSVRDLEGVLIQLVATRSLLGRSIDLELTRAALHKLATTEPQRSLEPAAVVRVVASFFQTTPEALASRSRRRDVLLPRQLAMYLCRRYTDAPLGEIARAFGREHPSVSNAVKVIERRMLERAPLRYQVEALCARLEERGAGVPAPRAG